MKNISLQEHLLVAAYKKMNENVKMSHVDAQS